MNPRERIVRLRAAMMERNLDAWIVPSSDPHQSEYVADYWQARAWLSGFCGSAGTVVVTQDQAGLWTDSRYHIRAEQELEGSGIELFKFGLPGVPSYQDWLRNKMATGATIGFDGSIFSVAQTEELAEALPGISLVYNEHLIQQIWDNRPAMPLGTVWEHEAIFAGETRASKLERIRTEMRTRSADALLLTALDDIAWTFNIRGADVAFNTVIVSFGLILADEARLFIDEQKVPKAVREALERDGVVCIPYDEASTIWETLSDDSIIHIDPAQTSVRLREIIAHGCRVQEGPSIPQALKAIKNEVQLQGFRQAHVRDGVAMVKFLAWLDGQEEVFGYTELTLAEKCTEFRQLGQHFVGPSFSPIVGFGPNAAVGHYSPQPETTPFVHRNDILLIDSGGHYLDGTTDITRTLTLGKPTSMHRNVYTQVLRSLIRLTMTKFPLGTVGSQLNTIGRQLLWQQGWECRHGIGHGVGHCMNVHEGPQRMHSSSLVPFQAGMVVSNEPGVYFEGRFGVRLENMMYVVPDEITEFGQFLSFETLTLCPFDHALIETSTLSFEERNWLNAYHQNAYDRLSPLLSTQEAGWLYTHTRPI